MCSYIVVVAQNYVHVNFVEMWTLFSINSPIGMILGPLQATRCRTTRGFDPTHTTDSSRHHPAVVASSYNPDINAARMGEIFAKYEATAQ